MSERLSLFATDVYTVVEDEVCSRCLDCGRDTIEICHYYMLRDEVWREANPDVHGMLCLDCLDVRLGRGIGRWDLSPAPVNVRFLLQWFERVVERWAI